MKRSNGFTVVFAAIFSVVASILIIALVRVLMINVNQTTYLNQMNLAYRLAETGMNVCLGKLANDPKSYLTFNGVQEAVTDGVYDNVVVQRNDVVPGGYYIVTSATRTVSGKSYSCRLHTHVRVSNVGDYFAAVKNELQVNDGVDVSQGKIYSPKLTFENIISSVTKVKAAEFVTQCTPALNWSAGLKSEIVISEPAFPADTSDPAKANQPVQRSVEMIFPQVFDADLDRYKTLAAAHTVTSNFTGDIFPPGYQEGSCNKLSGDLYAPHTCVNVDHVYYSAMSMQIEGIIHGQILFVSEGDIHIRGKLESADVSAALPGAGFASSSTAHQAILITPKDVIIDNSYYQVAWSTQAVQNIQALVLAPHGKILATLYDPATPHAFLSLNFKGSLILNTQPSNFSNVFNGDSKRIYSYMDTLKTNPPPYIPAITEIFYSIEE